MGKIPKDLHFPLHFPVDLHYPTVGKIVKEDKRNAKLANVGQVQALLNSLRMTVYADDAAATAAGYNEGDLYITEAGTVQCIVACVVGYIYELCEGYIGDTLYVSQATQDAFVEAGMEDPFFTILDPNDPTGEERINYQESEAIPTGDEVCNFFPSDMDESEWMPMPDCDG